MEASRFIILLLLCMGLLPSLFALVVMTRSVIVAGNTPSQPFLRSSTDTSCLKSLAPPAYWLQTPDESLRRGQWFKLICGASLQDVPMVRNLALVYTLAGANCIDVAAEEAVIEAAHEGITAALKLASAELGVDIPRPWLMMSVNDDEADPHFRKVAFDPLKCPADCPRPCEKVCPADAICFPDSLAAHAHTSRLAAMMEEKLQSNPEGGVLTSRCYGCGRCIDICPLGLIKAVPYVRTASSVISLLRSGLVQAIEIHTKGNVELFKQTWALVGSEAYSCLRLIAVSFPDLGEEGTPAAMAEWASTMQDTRIQQLTSASTSPSPSTSLPLHIWQTDGRPMSGDIGTGAAAAAVKFAHRVVNGAAETGCVALGDGVHFVQLAGGTNANTVPKLKSLKIAEEVARNSGEGGGERPELGGSWLSKVGGVAYGGYARKIVKEILDSLLPHAGEDGSNKSATAGEGRLEDFPEALEKAVGIARELMIPLKGQQARGDGG